MRRAGALNLMRLTPTSVARSLLPAVLPPHWRGRREVEWSLPEEPSSSVSSPSGDDSAGQGLQGAAVGGGHQLGQQAEQPEPQSQSGPSK